MRVERPLDELIRFVAAPDDSIVADLSQRLPGRGVWITAERASVAHAVKARAFERSLKRQVHAKEGLADEVEGLLVRRTCGALSLGVKAGAVVAGFAKVETAILKGNVAALVHGSDARPDGTDKLTRKFAAIQHDCGRVPAIVTALTITQLSLAIGRSNVVHAALTTGGAAQNFLREAWRLERYRLGFAAFDDAHKSTNVNG